jgi:hypothetical protein
MQMDAISVFLKRAATAPILALLSSQPAIRLTGEGRVPFRVRVEFGKIQIAAKDIQFSPASPLIWGSFNLADHVIL